MFLLVLVASGTAVDYVYIRKKKEPQQETNNICKIPNGNCNASNANGGDEGGSINPACDVLEMKNGHIKIYLSGPTAVETPVGEPNTNSVLMVEERYQAGKHTLFLCLSQYFKEKTTCFIC